MAKRTFGQRKIATKNNFTNREALEKGGMDTLADRITMAANVAMSGNPMSAGNGVKKKKRKAPKRGKIEDRAAEYKARGIELPGAPGLLSGTDNDTELPSLFREREENSIFNKNIYHTSKDFIGSGFSRKKSVRIEGPRDSKKRKSVPFRGKKDSIHFLEACVTDYRMYPRTNKVFENFSSTWKLASTTEWANLLSRQTQYFDCDIIWEYVSENYKNMYPDYDVPPSPDCVLPAENVALYLSKFSMEMLDYYNPIEALFLCIPQNANLDQKDPYYRKSYHVFLIAAGEATVDLGQFTMPLPIGNIVVADTETGPDHVFEHLLMHEIEKYGFVKEEAKEMLRIVAAMLQTINQPRYVRRAQRDVSQIKRQRIKNSLGRYIPDAWNMISWNVDEPVMAKTSDEGTGSRQGLHYRRGHWRKAESHWAGARWSETRLRWETYIHGYEAGHPKYGVLKSFHVPRKDKK